METMKKVIVDVHYSHVNNNISVHQVKDQSKRNSYRSYQGILMGTRYADGGWDFTVWCAEYLVPRELDTCEEIERYVKDNYGCHYIDYRD